MSEYLTLVLEHWSFFAFSGIMWASLEVLKKAFPEPKEKKAHAYIRAFFPLYPILVGALFGLIKNTPVPDMLSGKGVISASLYYAAAGLCAIYARDLVRTARSYSPWLPDPK